jgi:RNA recognition motif-containing protein
VGDLDVYIQTMTTTTTTAAFSLEAQQQYLNNQTIIRSFNLEKSVYVANIAKPVTEAVLKQFFSHCGEVVQLKILQYAPFLFGLTN